MPAVPEVMCCVLPCMLEAVKGELVLLEMLETMEESALVVGILEALEALEALVAPEVMLYATLLTLPYWRPRNVSLVSSFGDLHCGSFLIRIRLVDGSKQKKIQRYPKDSELL